MRAHPDYPGYFISSDGAVSTKYGTKILKPRVVGRDGYHQVVLYVDGNRVARYVHQLVLEVYVSKKPDGYECMHINDDVSDNRLENLCWGTHSENMLQSVKRGTHVSYKLRGIPFTDEHKKSISDGLKRAWARKRAE